MSQTFELICIECNKRQWIGQSKYIYTTSPEIEDTAEFLHLHYGHLLKFVESQEACKLEDEFIHP